MKIYMPISFADSGAEDLQSPTKKIMEVTAKVMTSTSAHI